MVIKSTRILIRLSVTIRVVATRKGRGVQAQPVVGFLLLPDYQLMEGTQRGMNISQNTQTINYDTALKYSIYLGWLGVDRFYMGDKGMGILKICLFFFLFIIPWLVDIAVIRSHKDNWEQWIASKREKHEAVQATKNEQLEAAQLQKDRESNGQCPKCGSTNLTAVSETTNRHSGAATIWQLANMNKLVTADKIISKIKRVCLNCGNKF